jgi:hypothetical protein
MDAFSSITDLILYKEICNRFVANTKKLLLKSNRLRWRTRLQPIRTASEITAQIKIYPIRRVYLYQNCSQKAKELRLLGMSYEQIAKSLNISKKTAINTCKHEKV